MEYINSLEWRYATKKFDASKKVSEETLQRILYAANLTATSLGFQPIKIINVQPAHLREKIRSASFNQSQVTDASHLLVLCVDANFSTDRVNQYIQRISQTRNVPVENLVGFENSINKWIINLQDDNSRVNWAAKQAYITLGTMLTACAIEQVDSCPMEGFIPEQVSEILELQSRSLFPVLMLPIGYRSNEDANQHLPKVRMPLSEYVINI
jgi:nitroreductase / dihydropteridine reductase